MKQEQPKQQHCAKCKGLGVYVAFEYNPNNPSNKCPDCDGIRTVEFKEKVDFIDGKFQTWKQAEESKSTIKERMELSEKLKELGVTQLDKRIYSKKKK